MGTTVHAVVNDELEWSRGKRSAHAVHASLMASGIRYTHPVVVLNAHRGEVAENPDAVQVNDSPAAAARFETADSGERRMVVRVVVSKRQARDTTARLAALAALKLYQVDRDVTVRGGTAAEILELPFTVRDQGRTELEPGTLTAGAEVADSVPEVLCATEGLAHAFTDISGPGAPRWSVIDAYGDMSDFGLAQMTEVESQDRTQWTPCELSDTATPVADARSGSIARKGMALAIRLDQPKDHPNWMVLGPDGQRDMVTADALLGWSVVHSCG